MKCTAPAKEDLKEIYDYIARDSRFYAQKVADEIGRIVPEMRYENVREIFVYSYRLIYEISPEKIYILALVHTKQIISNEFLSRSKV